MQAQKIVVFAFRGDPMCFAHVLLNALDISEKGLGGKIVLEGEATKLLAELTKPEHPLSQLYHKAKEKNLFAAVCRACATKMGVLDSIEKEGLPFGDDMAGHPGMSKFINEGYRVITL
jgi:hypothetical protein